MYCDILPAKEGWVKALLFYNQPKRGNPGVKAVSLHRDNVGFFSFRRFHGPV